MDVISKQVSTGAFLVLWGEAVNLTWSEDLVSPAAELFLQLSLQVQPLWLSVLFPVQTCFGNHYHIHKATWTHRACMKGLERPIYFTSCAASNCKWEKEEKEEEKEVIQHLLCRKSVHGLSNLSHPLIQESRTTRLGQANLPLRAGSRRPRAPVWFYCSARANFQENAFHEQCFLAL